MTWTRRIQRNVPGALRGLRRLGFRRTLVFLLGLRAFGGRSEAASVYPGVQNLLLTARALGLGATLTTWHLTIEAEFKRVLGIPRGVHTFAVIPVGGRSGRSDPSAGGRSPRSSTWIAGGNAAASLTDAPVASSRRAPVRLRA